MNYKNQKMNEEDHGSENDDLKQIRCYHSHSSTGTPDRPDDEFLPDGKIRHKRIKKSCKKNRCQNQRYNENGSGCQCDKNRKKVGLTVPMENFIASTS